MTPEERAELERIADEHRAAVDAEYSQFAAAQDIYVGQFLAYAKGAPVPVSNVKRHGYLQNGLVITAEQAARERAEQAAADERARKAAEDEQEAAFQAALQQQGAPPAEPETSDTAPPSGDDVQLDGVTTDLPEAPPQEPSQKKPGK